MLTGNLGCLYLAHLRCTLNISLDSLGLTILNNHISKKLEVNLLGKLKCLETNVENFIRMIEKYGDGLN